MTSRAAAHSRTCRDASDIERARRVEERAERDDTNEAWQVATDAWEIAGDTNRTRGAQ